MKKFFLFLITLSVLAAPLLFAEEAYDPADEIGDSKQGKLIDLHASRTSSRIQNLEKRIDQIDRDMRSQNERIRNLERAVDNVERYH